MATQCCCNLDALVDEIDRARVAADTAFHAAWAAMGTPEYEDLHDAETRLRARHTYLNEAGLILTCTPDGEPRNGEV